MLSAESAAGKYPVEAVAMMNNVSKFTENSLK
jgi:pyruvate kinase